ncbi:hypothetical protein D3C78_1656650 [compost metagenome]
MRSQHLFALVTACALALPLTAQAEWPADEKAKYMDACETAAMNNKVSKSVATQHCECSAGVIDKKFTKDEVAELNSGGPRVALQNRLISEVQKACGTAK